MMKTTSLIVALTLCTAFAFAQEKVVTKTGHIQFVSKTDAEEFSANNYKVTSAFTPGTGEFVFSVPMQSFEFKKSLMQKHYNSKNYLDTKTYPKAKFKGKVDDMSKVDLSKDGTYTTKVSGDLEMHGVTKAVSEEGTITVKDGKVVAAQSSFPITLADYGVEFTKGKQLTNIAKTVDITVDIKF